MRRSSVGWFGLVIVGLAIGGARTAEACKCARPSNVAFVSQPYVDPGSGLELRSPSVAVRCEGRRELPRCEYEARYIVHNPSAAPVRAPAVVIGSVGTHPQVWIDGGLAPERPPDALDERAEHHAREAVASDRQDELHPMSQRGFVIDMPANASMVVRVATPIQPTEDRCDCGELQIERWHPVVSGRMERTYLVDHLEGFGFRKDDDEPREEDEADRWRRPSGVPIEQITEVPLRWSMPSWRAPHPRKLHGGRWEARSSTQLYEGRGTWSFGARPPVLWGGPFVAVGVGWRDEPGLALRAGWEVARPAWLVTSLAVESDAHTFVSVVPTIEATFPYWSRVLVMFPAPALGVGAPIEVWPEPRAAVRTQLRLGWHVLSILGALDVYPPQAGWSGDLRGALMFQLGL